MKIATWNLKTCGRGKAIVIAEKFADLIKFHKIDVITIQEVGFTGAPVTCADVLQSFMNLLPDYTLISTADAIGGGHGGREYLPIIYKTAFFTTVIVNEAYELQTDFGDQDWDEVGDILPPLGGNPRKCVFYRMLCVSGVEFDLVNVHLNTGFACQQLTRILESGHVTANDIPVIIAGDLNITSDRLQACDTDSIMHVVHSFHLDHILITKNCLIGTTPSGCVGDKSVEPGPMFQGFPVNNFSYTNESPMSDHSMLVCLIDDHQFVDFY
jgi:endonuclease/exonuclease/phosphatase family metal-dependent hydrolase